MTEMQRDVAKQITKHPGRPGLNRREAIRLGLLGVAGSVATGVLPAFAAGEAAAAGSGTTEWAPVAREPITFAGPRASLMAAWAPAAEPRGGVLVIHENRGLNEHIRTIAGRLAASEYSALALDLLSEEGGTGSFPDEATVAAALAQIPPERHVADMNASLTELARRVGNKRLSVIGFGFGGAMVWHLLSSDEQRLASAVPFYGPFPDGGSLEGSRAAVLGIYGGLDSRVNATLAAAQAAVDAEGLKYELLTFTDADHGFFNDTGARFNPHAAAEAWRRMLNWFDPGTRRA